MWYHVAIAQRLALKFLNECEGRLLLLFVFCRLLAASSIVLLNIWMESFMSLIVLRGKFCESCSILVKVLFEYGLIYGTMSWRWSFITEREQPTIKSSGGWSLDMSLRLVMCVSGAWKRWKEKIKNVKKFSCVGQYVSVFGNINENLFL